MRLCYCTSADGACSNSFLLAEQTAKQLAGASLSLSATALSHSDSTIAPWGESDVSDLKYRRRESVSTNQRASQCVSK